MTLAVAEALNPNEPNQQHNPVTKDKVKVTKTDLNPQNILPKDTGIHYVDSKAYAFS